ncbi:MAG: hypothetical protein KatS3mg131_2768 [Candidatus Tectimicrobiota bacterium]|nr:MAG: hypothetical protein KatS3mg131_2768 [Candidatus Tectomicrobia bacterium]
MSGLLSRLAEGLLLGDGAMGTLLADRGDLQGQPPEALLLRQPARIVAVHRAYLEAGAQLLTTNTFGGNRLRLARAGLARQVRELNRTAAALAREVAGTQALVGGCLGPTGTRRGEYAAATLQEVFAEQAAALAEGGADCLVLETLSALEEAQAALAGVRMATDLPVVCLMTFGANLRTATGVTPEEAAQALLSWGADVVGANCGLGPQQVEAVLCRMRQACPQASLAARPSAGLPRQVGKRAVYDLGPEAFAAAARRLAALGVRLLGACCGSTPACIAAMAKAVQKKR